MRSQEIASRMHTKNWAHWLWCAFNLSWSYTADACYEKLNQWVRMSVHCTGSTDQNTPISIPVWIILKTFQTVCTSNNMIDRLRSLNQEWRANFHLVHVTWWWLVWIPYFCTIYSKYFKNSISRFNMVKLTWSQILCKRRDTRYDIKMKK